MRSKALQVQGYRLADAAQRLLTRGTLADATGERGDFGDEDSIFILLDQDTVFHR